MFCTFGTLWFLVLVSRWFVANVFDSGWVNATLDFPLTIYDILPDVTIADVMDPEGGYLCYTYDY